MCTVGNWQGREVRDAGQPLRSQNGVSLWHSLPAAETKVLVALALPSGRKSPSGFGPICQPWCRERFLFFSSTVQNGISGSKYARTHYNPVVKSVLSCPVVGLFGSLRGTSKVHLCPVRFILIARTASWALRSRVGWSHNLNMKVQHFIFNITLLLLGSPFHFKVHIIISLNVSWFVLNSALVSEVLGCQS